jgi:hypothetical protein
VNKGRRLGGGRICTIMHKVIRCKALLLLTTGCSAVAEADEGFVLAAIYFSVDRKNQTMEA